MDICDHRDHVVNTRVAEVLQQGSVFVVNSHMSLVYLVQRTEYHHQKNNHDDNNQKGFTFSPASQQDLDDTLNVRHSTSQQSFKIEILGEFF